MKVQNDKIKAESVEVKQTKAMTSGKALTGEEVVNTASDIFRAEDDVTTDTYTSLADYKAKLLNNYMFGEDETPTTEFQSLMPLPPWSSQRGLYISADAYETRVCKLQKTVSEMRANIFRELNLKAGQYTVGERASMLDRIKELDDMLRNCDVQLQKVRADKQTASILQDLEDKDLI